MTQQYPPSWSGLDYPWQRAELIAYLLDAQNLALWQEPDEVKFLMHFVFDDHDFQPPSQQLGFMLLDDEEVDAMTAFVTAFSSALGPRSKRLSEISAEEWSVVARTAAHARLCLLQKGESWFKDECEG
ncbi:MAG: hypothetical protein IV086_05535 [Hyphomonadaceae bacterium]|nr:MAG: Uncharacterized protein FD160_127 [Caulobacteraceae bacterium]MBT9445140.1 hypothetical protein [Hyphomonadaceae bacterium]